MQSLNSKYFPGKRGMSFAVSVIVIVILIGIFAIKIKALIEEAERTKLAQQGSEFKASIFSARAQWFLNSKNYPSIIDINGTKIAFNHKGWPVDIKKDDFLAAPTTINRLEQCERLWWYLSDYQKSLYKGLHYVDKQFVSKEPEKKDIEIKQAEHQCWFYFIKNNDSAYIHYHVNKGKITW